MSGARKGAHERRIYDRPGTSLALIPCPVCGKWRYPTRRAAKTAARQHEARAGRMRVYRCGGYWHLTGQDTATVTWHRERDT